MHNKLAASSSTLLKNITTLSLQYYFILANQKNCISFYVFTKSQNISRGKKKMPIASNALLCCCVVVWLADYILSCSKIKNKKSD